MVLISNSAKNRQNRAALFLLFFLLFLGCTSKVIKPIIPAELPPNEIPKFAFTQLEKQLSFRFRLYFKTDTPALLEAEFEGSVILPNQEERTGIWNRLDEKTSIHIKGIGDFQYEKTDGKWEIHPRGEESNILIQIERILLHSQFELKAKDSKQMVFTFKPNLIFLDPTQSKPMNGLLFINGSTLLPEKIQVSDSARTAFWEIRFFAYNRKNKISYPFTPKVRIQLTAELKIDNKIKAILIDRFQRLGFQAKAKTYSSNLGPILEIQLEKDIPETQLNLIISQGQVKIYSGDWLESKTVRPDTGLSYYQFKPVQFHELILTHQDIERAEVNLNQGPEPLLELQLKPKSNSKIQESFEKDGKLLFLLLNDEIIGYSPIIKTNQTTNKIVYKGIGDVLKVTTVAAIIKSGPINQSLKILSKSTIQK